MGTYFAAKVENLCLEPLMKNLIVFAKWLSLYFQDNRESAKVIIGVV